MKNSSLVLLFSEFSTNIGTTSVNYILWCIYPLKYPTLVPSVCPFKPNTERGIGGAQTKRYFNLKFVFLLPVLLYLFHCFLPSIIGDFFFLFVFNLNSKMFFFSVLSTLRGKMMALCVYVFCVYVLVLCEFYY